MARYKGTAGNDVHVGGAEADVIQGLGGHDRLFGGAGADKIYSDDGDDVLSSNAVFSDFFGEAVDPGVEADLLDGGAGNDRLAGGYNDTIAGRDGDDVLWLDLRGAGAGVTLDLSPLATGRGVRNGTGVISGIEAYAFIRGSEFDDDIRAGSLRTFGVLGGGISGGAGNDRIDGGTFGAGTNNALFARRLSGDAGDDAVFGSEGSDTLLGGEGNDRIATRGGADIAYGDAGDDVLDLRGFGNKRADGGAGGDAVILGGTRSDWSARANEDGTVSLFREQAQPNGASGVEVTIGEVESVRFDDGLVRFPALIPGLVLGTAGNDRLAPASAGFAGAVVTTGADLLYGLGGDDYLDGGAGADEMWGGEGADTFVVADAGDRVVDAGFGDVILSSISYAAEYSFRYQGPSRVQLVGTADIDADDPFAAAIVGNAGNNRLTGSGVLEGGLGNDTLQGGLGATASYEHAASRVAINLAATGPQDTLGAGVDTLIGLVRVRGSAFNDSLAGSNSADMSEQFEGGRGDDRINGRRGFDTASYEHAESGVTVRLGIVGAQDTVGAGRDTLTSIEGLLGSAFADVLSGAEGDDTLAGGGGNDRLFGGGGRDFIDGGDGDDVIDGGAGENRVDGGFGADRIAFGADALGWENRIVDYRQADGDLIDLSAIDADAGTAGDQAFDLVAAFTGRAGELIVEEAGAGVYFRISGDIDGDAIGDFSVFLDTYYPFAPDTAIVL